MLLKWNAGEEKKSERQGVASRRRRICGQDKACWLLLVLLIWSDPIFLTHRPQAGRGKARESLHSLSFSCSLPPSSLSLTLLSSRVNNNDNIIIVISFSILLTTDLVYPLLTRQRTAGDNPPNASQFSPVLLLPSRSLVYQPLLPTKVLRRTCTWHRHRELFFFPFPAAACF